MKNTTFSKMQKGKELTEEGVAEANEQAQIKLKQNIDALKDYAQSVYDKLGKDTDRVFEKLREGKGTLKQAAKYLNTESAKTIKKGKKTVKTNESFLDDRITTEEETLIFKTLKEAITELHTTIEDGADEIKTGVKKGELVSTEMLRDNTTKYKDRVFLIVQKVFLTADSLYSAFLTTMKQGVVEMQRGVQKVMDKLPQEKALFEESQQNKNLSSSLSSTSSPFSEEIPISNTIPVSSQGTRRLSSNYPQTSSTTSNYPQTSSTTSNVPQTSSNYPQGTTTTSIPREEVIIIPSSRSPTIPQGTRTSFTIPQGSTTSSNYPQISSSVPLSTSSTHPSSTSSNYPQSSKQQPQLISSSSRSTEYPEEGRIVEEEKYIVPINSEIGGETLKEGIISKVIENLQKNPPEEGRVMKVTVKITEKNISAPKNIGGEEDFQDIHLTPVPQQHIPQQQNYYIPPPPPLPQPQKQKQRYYIPPPPPLPQQQNYDELEDDFSNLKLEKEIPISSSSSRSQDIPITTSTSSEYVPSSSLQQSQSVPFSTTPISHEIPTSPTKPTSHHVPSYYSTPSHEVPISTSSPYSKSQNVPIMKDNRNIPLSAHTNRDDAISTKPISENVTTETLSQAVPSSSSSVNQNYPPSSMNQHPTHSFLHQSYPSSTINQNQNYPSSERPQLSNDPQDTLVHPITTERMKDDNPPVEEGYPQNLVGSNKVMFRPPREIGPIQDRIKESTANIAENLKEKLGMGSGTEKNSN